MIVTDRTFDKLTSSAATCSSISVRTRLRQERTMHPNRKTMATLDLSLCVDSSDVDAVRDFGVTFDILELTIATTYKLYDTRV